MGLHGLFSQILLGVLGLPKMNPVILGFYVSLAYRIYCGVPALSNAASSSHVSVAMDSSVYNAAAASGVKWSPSTEEYHQKLKEGKTLELEYNRKTGDVTEPKTLRNRRTTQQKNMIPPSQPPMQRSVYSDNEMQQIVQGVDSLLNGKESEDSMDSSLVPIEESDRGFPGYCGQIKVYDSEDPDQLLAQNCGCQSNRCGRLLDIYTCTPECCALGAVICCFGMYAACNSCDYAATHGFPV